MNEIPEIKRNRPSNRSISILEVSLMLFKLKGESSLRMILLICIIAREHPDTIAATIAAISENFILLMFGSCDLPARSAGRSHEALIQ